MLLADFLAELDVFVRDATAAFGAAGDAATLEAARVQFLGAKSGCLKTLQKGLGQVEKADKPAAGKRFHEVKNLVESSFEAASEKLKNTLPPFPQTTYVRSGKTGRREQRLKSRVFAPPFIQSQMKPDPTVPGVPIRLGRLHPITQTINELKEIMGRLGFTAVEGPEVEDPWHNFEALNIPAEHPARDPLENF
jgi:phenylalanyl-tRNA synthetase alpha chain